MTCIDLKKSFKSKLQVLSVPEYMQLMNVVQRLQEAHKHYFDVDIDDMM